MTHAFQSLRYNGCNLGRHLSWIFFTFFIERGLGRGFDTAAVVTEIGSSGLWIGGRLGNMTG